MSKRNEPDWERFADEKMQEEVARRAADEQDRCFTRQLVDSVQNDGGFWERLFHRPIDLSLLATGVGVIVFFFAIWLLMYRPVDHESPSASGGSSALSSDRVNVKGYHRQDGTHVAPHTRSKPRK